MVQDIRAANKTSSVGKDLVEYLQDLEQGNCNNVPISHEKDNCDGFKRLGSPSVSAFVNVASRLPFLALIDRWYLLSRSSLVTSVIIICFDATNESPYST